MDGKDIFSSKAEKYARYRWDYAPQAVEAVFRTTGLNRRSIVADIGAGTGILTRHFAGRVGYVYAIEPNAEMLDQALLYLSGQEDWSPVAAQAENTTLPDSSVDLVTIATSLHWFDPEPARHEFRRILKPGGWLAVFHNHSTNAGLEAAIQAITVAENGVKWTRNERKASEPPAFYFAGGSSFKLDFPFLRREDWEEFFGSLLSTSYMPDEDHPLFPRLLAAARRVFDQFSSNDWLDVTGVTEVIIGQMAAS